MSQNPHTARRVRSGRDLGAALAEARRRQGLSQADLADVAHVDRTRVAKLEAGAETRLLTHLFRLLELLGLELFVRTRNPHEPGG